MLPVWCLRGRRGCEILRGGQDGEQGPDVDVTLNRQPERYVGSHVVPVAPPVPLALDVPGPGEVGDDALGRPLGDPQEAGDVADADAAVVGDQEQRLAVVREEGEVRRRVGISLGLSTTWGIALDITRNYIQETRNLN